MMENLESPNFVLTSSAAAITLNLKKGKFYRGAESYCAYRPGFCKSGDRVKGCSIP